MLVVDLEILRLDLVDLSAEIDTATPTTASIRRTTITPVRSRPAV